MTLRKSQKRLLRNSAFVALIALGTVALNSYMEYRNALKLEREMLFEAVTQHARIIEAVKKCASQQLPDENRKKFITAVNREIVKAYSKNPGFGRSSEIVIGYRTGAEIAFLTDHRHRWNRESETIPWDAQSAEPMRLALSGKEGTIINKDYRDAEVIAAYSFIPELNLGIVAKVDLEEIRSVYRTTAIQVSLLVLGILLLATYLLYRFRNPLIERIEFDEIKRQVILDNAADGIISIDHLGIVHSFNNSATKLFGYLPQQVVGNNIKMLMPSPYKEQHNGYIRAFLETGKTKILGKTREAIGLRKDGSTFPLELRVCEVKRPHNSKNRFDERVFVGCVRDLTEAKSVEWERLIHAEELTREQQRAEQANLSKSQFLANMSHEIRTPMAAILGYADILLESNLDFEQRNSLDVINRNGIHLLEIINDILDLSKVESGKLQIVTEKCSPAEVIQEISIAMNVRAEQKNLQLNANIDPSVPDWIRTDVTRLKQILINLVGNAIKFTEDGSVEIDISYHRSEAQPGELIVLVTDSGIGMTPEQLNLVFEPFTQVDSSSSRKHGGTGLGLTISKRFAKLLGGDLTAQCRLGEGCVFRLSIDAGEVGFDDSSKKQKKHCEVFSQCENAVTEEKAKSSLKGQRVLLVEDGVDNRRLISLFLEKSQIEYTVAENGKIAVDLVMESPEKFDTILMDMQMPVMDGYQATKAIRDFGYEKPILAITAHAMTGDREKCLACGCDDYLTKPIFFKTLISILEKHLSAIPVAAT